MMAPEVAKWQQKYRAEWDATDGRNGGAQRTVWEILLDLAKAFERVSLLVVWAWAKHFGFPREILRVFCGYFEHQRRVQFEGV